MVQAGIIEPRTANGQRSTLHYPESIDYVRSLGRSPQIAIQKDIPNLAETETILDIDLDFFTHNWGFLSRFLLERRIYNFTRILKQRVNPALTTIAISTGWTKAGEEDIILRTVLQGLGIELPKDSPYK